MGKMAAQIWVIGAGKGGVGKSFVASSLGITLSKLNHSVLTIDFDCSGANLHTYFGMGLGQKNIRNYFEKNEPLANLIDATPIPHLSYIQGFWDSWEPNAITPAQTQKLVSDARDLKFDHIIFDCGPGSSPAYLELYDAADEKIFVTNPEPNSVEKAYRLIENYIFHQLKRNCNADATSRLQQALESYRRINNKQLFSFRKFIAQETGLTPDYFDNLNSKPIRLIVNQARSRQDQDLGFSMKSVCNKFFDLQIDYLGALDFDNAVWHSLRERRPFLIEKPFTPLAGQFLTIAKTLVPPNFSATSYKAVI
jgi:flagellar biosynthesis protein FlhG